MTIFKIDTLDKSNLSILSWYATINKALDPVDIKPMNTSSIIYTTISYTQKNIINNMIQTYNLTETEEHKKIKNKLNEIRLVYEKYIPNQCNKLEQEIKDLQKEYSEDSFNKLNSREDMDKFIQEYNESIQLKTIEKTTLNKIINNLKTDSEKINFKNIENPKQYIPDIDDSIETLKKQMQSIELEIENTQNTSEKFAQILKLKKEEIKLNSQKTDNKPKIDNNPKTNDTDNKPKIDNNSKTNNTDNKLSELWFKLIIGAIGTLLLGILGYTVIKEDDTNKDEQDNINYDDNYYEDNLMIIVS